MRTRQIVGLGLVLAIGVFVAQATTARAESGRPSRQMMEAMGLGSLVVISDDEAMAVRGHGYKGGGSHVSVSGNSFATVNGGPLGGAHSENAYSADGKHKASGSNLSYAGVADIWVSSKGGHKDKGKGGGKPGGDYGGMPGGGMNGGHPGGNGGGGGYGGGGGGYGGGKPTVKIHATVFFAGGTRRRTPGNGLPRERFGAS